MQNCNVLVLLCRKCVLRKEREQALQKEAVYSVLGTILSGLWDHVIQKYREEHKASQEMRDIVRQQVSGVRICKHIHIDH